MIPLIHHTPRLTLLAASRALLTAELHKPRYFPVLLGATIPAAWPPDGYDEATLHDSLDQLTIGGRHAAGWYGWYAIRKATPDTPKTLIGAGGFMGPPDGGTVEISYSVVDEWREQGLATELVAGLLEQAAATGMVRHVVAHTLPDHTAASQQVLLANGFQATGTDAEGRQRFERDVEPAEV